MKRTMVGFIALLVVATPIAVSQPIRAGVEEPPSGFDVPCNFSHRNFDDPIVFPGQVGAAHEHDFYGSKTTDASSTLESMRASDSSCKSSKDTAGYWHPTLYVNGQPVTAIKLFAYYRVPSGEDRADVQPIPADLKMIAGDAHATEPPPPNVAYWTCGGDLTDAPRLPAPYDCEPYGGQVLAHVRFPSCWDGVNLDSPDHQSHMAYPHRDNGCPATHPVPVARVNQSVEWPIVNGEEVTLSSGGPYTLHGDFWNTWDQEFFEGLVEDCLNVETFCHSIVDDGFPSVGSVFIEPSTVHETQVATATANQVSDPEGGPVQLRWRWTVNGVRVGGNSSQLPVRFFDVGDELKVSVVPVDQEGQVGDRATSAPKIVQWPIQGMSGLPGGTIAITGGGFRPNERVDVHIDGPNGRDLGMVLTDTVGEFNRTVLDLPTTLTGGRHFLYGVGRESHITGRGPITILPTGEIDPDRVGAGESITFTGDGWVPGERVTVAFPRGRARSATTRANGTVTVVVTSPDLPSGPTVVTATALSGVVTDTFFPDPRISGPTTGRPGETIPMKLTGYGASESVQFRFDDGPVSQTFSTNSNGSLLADLVLDTTFGLHSIRATGVTSGVDLIHRNVSMPQWMEVEPAFGPPGTTAHITSLHGWPAGQPLDFMFGVQNPIDPVADADGSVEFDYVIPNRQPADVTMKLKSTQLNLTATFTFTIT